MQHRWKYIKGNLHMTQLPIDRITSPLKPSIRCMLVLLPLSVSNIAGCKDESQKGSFGNDASRSARQITSSSTTNSPVSSETENVVEAGIFFRNEANYLCIPLTRLGVSDDRKVMSVTSSCECMVPSIVKYFSNSGTTKYAIRLDFQDKESNDRTNPLSLSVKIQLELERGGSRAFNVSFISASKDEVEV
jgi:hypothetical protein